MDLREPPAKKRKSRFGPQPTQAKPFSSNLSIADDLQRRQEQALAVAAKLSQDLGLTFDSSATNSVAPPNESSFLQTASMFQNQQHRSGLGFGKIFEERVYIPKDDYPNINFIGLILGPKGLNQKRMQSETGCRILVKGKGSSKNGIPDNDPEEPLHVYVSADTLEKTQRGVNKIKELIRESTDKYDEGGMEVKEHRHNGYIDVEIPNSQIGVVIGKQGNNIQRIQDITGATVMISPRNVPNNPLMKMITISGTPHQCEEALNEIYKTIEELRAFRARLKKQQQQHNKYNHEHHHHHHVADVGNDDLLNNSHHRDYGTASYDPNFVYPDEMYPEDVLPKISSGNVESGFCEIIIPNSVVGLIIGKNASNVKAMKDRTRCDIRVQKDEETLPDADSRLVALRGCVQSIKAARQEIAKVIHMANQQKQGATIGSMGANYQQMMYQNQQQMMYQQMMYQQMGYAQQPYGQYQWPQQQQPPNGPPPDQQQQAMDPAQQQQMHQAYMQQWQQYQQQQPQQPQGQPPPPPPEGNEDSKANTATDSKEDDNKKQECNPAAAETANTNGGGGQYDPNAVPPPQNEASSSEEKEKKNENNTDSKEDTKEGQSQTTLAQQQYQQQMQSYGWTPQQIAAYQQYPQYYQQYYQQYAQQYPQQYAQYMAAMQQQQQTQPAAPPPPPPETETQSSTDDAAAISAPAADPAPAPAPSQQTQAVPTETADAASK